jgi:structure-specific endonuclease subunit SLX1
VGRPWDMVMIVYGFPSKVAALQFEWAWQHPWKTRHLRTLSGGDDSGRGRAIFNNRYGLSTLKARVNVVRTMITSQPYSNWPLHVKLFNMEAAKAWEEVGRGNGQLPMGFTSAIELEGVDGKKANVHVGSGRSGPIDVSDSKLEPDVMVYSDLGVFQTYSHLHTLLWRGHWLLILVHRHARSVKSLLISVRLYVSFFSPSLCHVLTGLQDPVTVCLCPTPTCHSLTHITCLSEHFHNQDSLSPIIPRGGECPTCQTWVSWGDIVKGMYRRKAGRAVEVEEDPDHEQDEDGDPELVGTLDDADFEAALGVASTPVTKKGKGKGKAFGKGSAQAISKRKPYRSKKGTFTPPKRGRTMPISQVGGFEGDEGDFGALLNAVGATGTDKDGVPYFQLGVPPASQPSRSSVKQPVPMKRSCAPVKTRGADPKRGLATISKSKLTQAQTIFNSDEGEDFGPELGQVSDTSVEQ